jgi:hypothetical protein
MRSLRRDPFEGMATHLDNRIARIDRITNF